MKKLTNKQLDKKILSKNASRREIIEGIHRKVKSSKKKERVKR